MTLRTSALGLKIIEAFEADKLKGYRCPARVPTIGRGITGPAVKSYGETINYADGTSSQAVMVGKTITQEESDRLFRVLVDHFENAVEKALGASAARLTPMQFDACVSLAWNIGVGAFARSTVCKRIRAGNLEGVPSAIMFWNKAGGRELAGLTRRRRAEAALWRGDLREAEHYLGMKLGKMPQRVDEPKPPKTMKDSTIGQGTIISGAGGAIAAGKATADSVRDAVSSGTSLWETALAAGPWLLIAMLVVAAAVYVWHERKRKLTEDLV